MKYTFKINIQKGVMPLKNHFGFHKEPFSEYTLKIKVLYWYALFEEELLTSEEHFHCTKGSLDY